MHLLNSLHFLDPADVSVVITRELTKPCAEDAEELAAIMRTASPN